MSTHRLTTSVAATGLAAGMIAAAALVQAPTANATCASFFGLGNSANCTSTPLSIAIAIGNNASAKAEGLFGAAFAAGTNATALTSDAFTFAVGAGDGSLSITKGLFGIGVTVGPGTTAGTQGDPALGNLGFNIALNISPTNPGLYPVVSGGVGNLAVNLFGTSTVFGTKEVLATGYFNVATNVGGNNNDVWAASGFLSSALNLGGSDGSVKAGGGALDSAINLGGSGNTVYASPGPLAVAVSVGQSGATVSKQQPGININGFRLPNTAAALNSGKKARPAAASTRPNDDNDSTGKRSTGGSGRSGR